MENMNLPELIERFGSEEKCRAYLEELRWPDGVQCPRCESKKISRIVKRKQFDCDGCRYQFSVTAGTLFHDSHLPLWKWFLAIYLIIESRKGISANQLRRTLKVSYKTAWYMTHRIRDAMGDDDQPPLKGIVEADEMWHGGKVRGKGMGPTNSGNKTTILGVVERGGDVRLKVTMGRDRGTITRFLTSTVDDKATAIYTDGHHGYRGIGDDDTKHDWVDHQAREYVRGEVHTNTVEGVWSLFKRSVIGSYHQISFKHLPAYVDEFEWRFNNRNNPFLFRDTLKLMVSGDKLTFRELVAPKPLPY